MTCDTFPKDLWKLLQAEHCRTLTAPLFMREWNTFRVEFSFFPAFLAYVDSIQRGPTRLNPDAAILRHIAAIGGWRSFRRSHPGRIQAVVQRIPNFHANRTS